ncbi:hypothetical protein LOK49_LG04G03259 [Camellia lanceoleosa]|uniref:Uncharacterized protein n=1 Tax=Camellia lanceoleosa TaxID=1840588 RepID=A0ACC0HZK9_9ERIC|nr:hypothetical protein LOK49_LG04G03259 [Camellia lanceoleosa]
MSTPPILEGLLALVVFLYPLAKMDKIREFNGVFESGKSTTGLCMFTTTIINNFMRKCLYLVEVVVLESLSCFVYFLFVCSCC